MNTRHTNTRPVLSAALAAGVFCAAAPMRAQAPTPSNEQKLEGKVESLQAQVNALQAQVKRLQAQVRASSPSAVISPFYKVPDIQIPNYKTAPFQIPGIQGFQFPSGSFQTPGGLGQPPLIIVPRTYSKIPPCQITLIGQTPR